MIGLKLFVLSLIVSYGATQVTGGNCVCVLNYLCDKVNGSVITDGRTLINERFSVICSKEQCNCKGLDVCCFVNTNETTTEIVTTVPQDTTISMNISPPTPRVTKTKNKCGFSNPNGFGFKIGNSAEESPFGEFPWMTLITTANGHMRCGGTLIHPSVVLTAAHCVTKNEKYTVKAGEWDLSSTRELFRHQERQVVSRKIHPDYRPGIHYNDIALLFLESGFNLEYHIGIACLPPKNTIVNDTDCIATGWGKNMAGGHGTYASILKKVSLPMVEKFSCQAQLRKTALGKRFDLHESFLCAGGAKDEDTCVGDGGGPLICPISDSDDDRYQQIGITSWGLGCNAEGVPGVYANVAFFRDWIDKQMKEKNYKTEVYQY